MLNSKEYILLTVSVGFALLVGATALMPASVYSSDWWFWLWATVALGIVIAICKCRLWRRPSVFGLHLSLLLILAGGGLTALSSVRGSVHLQPGTETAHFTTDAGEVAELPVPLTLDSFTPEYYPGMTFPRDFHSHITTSDGRSYHISMNRIARIDGWRLYQGSFDGQGGSVLLVSHDPLGTGVTYTGYALFALSGLAMLCSRRLWRSFAAASVLLVSLSASAAPAVPDSLSRALAEKSVVFRGRTVPYAEMADELTRKLTGRTSVGELTAERFVASMLVYPTEWADVPFLLVKSDDLRKHLGAEGKYVSPASLYTSSGTYIPQDLFGKSRRLDEEILKLDEKMALLSELWSGELFTPASEQLSPAQTRTHMLWTRLKPWKIYFMLVFTAAVLSVFLRRPVAELVCFATGIGIFVWNRAVAGYWPFSSSAGIIEFTAVMLCGLCVLVRRKSRVAGFIMMIMAGCLALVGWLSAREPSLTPLMPVLASPWLAIHVSLVMLAYAVLGSTLAVSLAACVMPGYRHGYVGLSLSLLAPGTYLLGLGIFVGAMWANVSWGRYWGWDPKETWALVTLLIYAIPLHRSLGLRSRPITFHVYVALASLSILMTYVGVNYLPSLHSYL